MVSILFSRRNYKTDPELSAMFLRFAARKELAIYDVNDFYITVTCDLGSLSIWNVNKFHAWGNEGTFINIQGQKYAWASAMPSRWAIYRMYRKLRRLPYKEDQHVLQSI